MANKTFDELTALVTELNQLIDEKSPSYYVKLTKTGGYKAFRTDNPNLVIDVATLREYIVIMKNYTKLTAEYDAKVEKFEGIVNRIKTVISEDEWEFVQDFLDGEE